MSSPRRPRSPQFWPRPSCPGGIPEWSMTMGLVPVTAVTDAGTSAVETDLVHVLQPSPRGMIGRTSENIATPRRARRMKAKVPPKIPETPRNSSLFSIKVLNLLLFNGHDISFDLIDEIVWKH